MPTGDSTSARRQLDAKALPTPERCSTAQLETTKIIWPPPLDPRAVVGIAAAIVCAVLGLGACGRDSTGSAPATTVPATQGNGSSANTDREPARANGTVERVIDGDTVRVKINGRAENVRLIGIDTPETVDPHRPNGCFGKEASDFTKAQLPRGTSVRLVLDVEARDRFGRLLVYLYRMPDNIFINAELARQGYANVLTYPPNVNHADEFVRLVKEARDNNRGLWQSCGAPKK